MKKNIGKTDRIFRFVIGIILIYLAVAVIEINYLKIILAVLGIISIVESFIGFCWLYKFLGINTRKQII